ncbi:MAG: hypothetical protein ABI862_06655 [Ilumatobacteraceae bacterium]
MELSGGIEALGEMHDTFMKLLETRPNARRIDVVRGDVESTLALVESVIETSA